MTGSSPVQTFSTPGLQVTAQEAPGFVMSESDWNRFGRHLQGLGEEVTAARDMFLLSTGIAVGALLSVLAWIAQLSQTKEPSGLFVAAGVVGLAITLASAGVAFMSFRTHQGLAKKLDRGADLLYDDMNHCHPFEK